MNEAEAKTKWCPMTRVLSGYNGGGNSALAAANRDEKSNNQCIGSACAMWREIEPQKYHFYPAADDKALEEPARPDDLPPSWNFTPFSSLAARAGRHSAAGWTESEEDARLRVGGYCGLAGKP